MRMGNFFRAGPIRIDRSMAATHPTIGIDHPTVVPTNFDPDEQGCRDTDADQSDG